MRKMLIGLFIVISHSSFADPHYVQALHPFMGEKQYQEYLKSFNEPFSVVTDSVDLDWDSGRTGKMYIYIYRINLPDTAKFTLDISCSGNETANIGITSNDPIIDKNNYISWSLNPEVNKKVEYIYSTNPPSQRKYYFNEEQKKSKTVPGPSCK